MATVKVQRVKSMHPTTKKPYYYIQTKAVGTMSTDDLVENFVREQHIPRIYAEGVLKGLASALFDYMKAGLSVQIPGLGTMRLVVTSKAQQEAKEATAATITGAKLQLIPQETVRKEIASFNYELVGEEEG